MTNFSAQEPALGYYYQIRYGLMLILMNEEENDISLSFETLDDIVVENINSTDLYQTKFHTNRKANLTDRSTDLWKTIRVWSEEIYNGLIDVDNGYFTLITTEKLPSTNIFQRLSEKKLSIKQTIDELNSIASETSNATNLPGYKAFNKLSVYQKKKLIEKIKILDSSLDFSNIEKEVKKKLRLTVEPSSLNSLFERLEGWWFGESILQLRSTKTKLIKFSDVQKKILDIIDQLKADNLPIDFCSHINISESEFITFSQRAFVKSLNNIGLGESSLKSSISDYLRTFKQRSQWIREDLLNPNDEHRYELSLISDWRTKYTFLLDEIDGKTDDELKKLGMLFYKKHYIDSIPQIYIRPRVTDPFLVRGSYHILSDKEQVRWYPVKD